MFVSCSVWFITLQPTSFPSFPAIDVTDIGVNLTDPVFRGYHHGRRKHEDDLSAVLERSRAAGVKSMIITGGSLHESKKALELAKEHGLYATVGCHPTRSTEFEKYRGGPDAYLEGLDALIQVNLTGNGRVVAVGECGLDYDRTHFASPEVQRKHFRSQLSLAKKYNLPLFLHSRAAHADFVQILREEGFGEDGGRAIGGKGGVVHSFTGSIEECKEYMDMGFHVGVNGCSLKSEANLAAVKSILPAKIMLETDAPWCSMTSTQASKPLLDSLPPSLRSLYFPPSTRPENFVYGKPVKVVPSKSRGHERIACALRKATLESAPTSPCPTRSDASFNNSATFHIILYSYNNEVKFFVLDSGHRTDGPKPSIGDEPRFPMPLYRWSSLVQHHLVDRAAGLLGCVSVPQLLPNYVSQFVFSRKRYRIRPRSPLSSAAADTAPGVSILRPIKGLDTNLYENLESSFTQEYPNFELLLSMADENDQALLVIHELLEKYPNVNARVIVGEEIVGVNPKVNNLIRSYREAVHDILWVLDSNVTVTPGTLARSVDILNGPPPSAPAPRRRIALVHHVPFALAHQLTLGSRIEEAFLNTNHAKMYIAINTVAIDSCVMGKSNLYRRSDLERVDGSLKPHTETDSDALPGERGLAAFGRFLAEDNMIAGALWHELDLRHDLSCDVALNTIGNMSLSDYIWRRVRWIRVRKHMTLAATLVEPFTESVVMCAIASSCLRYLIRFPVWLFIPIHFVLWILVDLDVYASLAGYPLPASKRWGFLAAWAVREILALPIWLLAIFGDEVEWRGKKYQVLRNGEVRRAASGQGIAGWFKWGRTRKDMDHYERVELAQD
ncbi:hypothetical protein EW146_g5959 [Bondarzewia mesenterica]|uniref:Ceramide glucosyltransferase n=1 Tax=Bondarzewia mesenterica TaxID=1095465 RepID=A0A4S4LVM5_9AGAM|nr:hypothetical protein EW146_g5959 [Bondarzewia mesenterica]